MKAKAKRVLALALALMMPLETVIQAGEVPAANGDLPVVAEEAGFDPEESFEAEEVQVPEDAGVPKADPAEDPAVNLEEGENGETFYEDDWDSVEEFNFDEDPIEELIEEEVDENSMTPQEVEEAWEQDWAGDWAWEEEEEPAVEGGEEAQEQESAWQALQERIDASAPDEVIVLAENVTASEEDGPIVIPADKTVAIELNGFVINRHLGSETADGMVIRVEGALTLSDNSASGNGAITGGNNAGGSGGGVLVVSGGSLTLNSGNITGNHVRANGGGVYLEDGASFTMLDGRITGNSADGLAGGVYAGTGSSFALRSGLIAGNTAVSKGSNVLLDDQGSMHLSGDVQVEDLAIAAGEETLVMIDNALTETSKVGLSAADGLTGLKVVTSGLSGNGSVSNFYSSDTNSYSTGLNADGELILGQTFRISFDPNGAYGSMQQGAVAGGSVYELPAHQFAAEHGYAFAGWQIGENIYQPGDMVTIAEDTVVTALWEMTWASLQESMNIQGGKVNIVLPSDLTAPAGAQPLSIPLNSYIALDLNGHTIGRPAEEAAMPVFSVTGRLTITDSAAGGRLSGLVQAAPDGTISMNAGTLDNVLLDAGGRLLLSGSPKIEAVSFQVPGMIFVTGPLDENAGIGVNFTGTAPADGQPVLITRGLADYAGADRFFSVDENYKVGLAEDGEAVLCMPVIITFAKGDDDAQGSMPDLEYKYGETFTLPECAYTPSDPDLTFMGWRLEPGDGQLKQAGYEATASASLTATAVWNGSWERLQNAVNDAKRGGVITLDRDVIAKNGQTPILIPEGKRVTIDLNGHVIDRALTEASADGHVITVSKNGSLTIRDTGSGSDAEGGSTGSTAGETAAEGGRITGGNSTGDGGAILVESGGRLRLEGGTISGNSARRGGGLFLQEDGDFTMLGGTVQGNTAGEGSADVYAADGFDVAGNCVIGEAALLPDSDSRIFVFDVMSPNSRIGIGVPSDQEKQPSAEGPVLITDGFEEFIRADLFTSTNDGFLSGRNEDGEAVLGVPASITFEKGDLFAGGSMSGARAAVGSVYTLPGCGFYEPSYDRAFIGWMINGDASRLYADNEMITVTGDMTITAVWDSAWQRLQQQIREAQPGEEIKLADNVEAEVDEPSLVIPAGKELTINLNGHTIDGKRTLSFEDGHIFTVYGALTITDPYGTYAGEVKGGVAPYGAGVYVKKGGSFTLSGGSIAHNRGGSGAGVYLEGGASFTMSGGSIKDNYGDKGGGVNAAAGSFVMTGGSIIENRARDAGDDLYARQITISGSSFIDRAHFLVGDAAPITVSGRLSRKVVIGVNVEGFDPQGKESVVLTQGLGGNGDADHFRTMEDEPSRIGLNEEGEAVLTFPVTITFERGAMNLQGEMNPVGVVPGLAYKLPECAFSPMFGGMEFLAWQVGEDEENLVGAGKEIVVYEDTTLTAKWDKFWPALQRKIDDAEDGSVITLKADVVAQSDDEPLHIGRNKRITLDLNGYKIDRHLGEPVTDYGYVMLCEGNLTIRDSSTEKTGGITGGNNTGDGAARAVDGVYSGYGGGIVVANGGVLTLEGGEISGNKAVSGGGIAIGPESRVTLMSGLITLNEAVGSGAGGDDLGGGVWVDNLATLQIYGGALSGNKSTTYEKEDLYCVGRFEVGGLVAVGAMNLAKGIIDVVRPLEAGTSIGVFAWPWQEDNLQVTRGLGDQGELGYFESVNTEHAANGINALGIDPDGEVVMGRQVVIHFDLDGSPTSMPDEQAVTGCAFEVPSISDIESPDGASSFKGWEVSGEPYASGDTFLITDDTTIKVLWETDWESLCLGLTYRNSGTVILYNDVKAPEGTDYIHIPSGVHAVLDLNGHTLDFAGEEYRQTQNMIKIERDASLTIRDRIDGGNLTGVYLGYVASVAEGGVFRLEDGSISGNTVMDGLVGGRGSFIMNGGSIEDNQSTSCGAVLVSPSLGIASFRMRGGSITGNTAEDNALGISAVGGVCVLDGTFTISGSPVITGNKSGDKEINLYLAEGQIMHAGGQLFPGALVGVTTQEELQGENLPIVLTSGLDGRYHSGSFVLDDKDTPYIIGLDGAGEILIGEPAVIRFDPGQGSGEMKEEAVIAGTSYQLPACTFKAPAGKSFLGWKLDAADTSEKEKKEGEIIPITENETVLTAIYSTGLDYVDEYGTVHKCPSWLDLIPAVVPDEEGVTLSEDGKSGGWYVVSENVRYKNRIRIEGNVNLILCDDMQLTADEGIHLIRGNSTQRSNSLTIWTQWAGNGSIKAVGNSNGSAGIGGDTNDAAGSFYMHGGRVEAYGDFNAAGIGGGDGRCGGTVEIFAGEVYAAGESGGAGIGGGLGGSQGGPVTIWRGDVEAVGGNRAAGIGGGENYTNELGDEERGGNGATVNIWGGTVTATGGRCAAGIGGGQYGSGGTLNVGGNAALTVTAGKQAKNGGPTEAVGHGESSDTHVNGSGLVVLSDTCSVKAGTSKKDAKNISREARENSCRSAYVQITAGGNASYSINAVISDRYEETACKVRVIKEVGDPQAINEAQEGETFALEMEPDAESYIYNVKAVGLLGSEGGQIALTPSKIRDQGTKTWYVYTMPAGPVNIEVDFMAKTYDITVDKATKNGKIEGPKSAAKDERVRITVTPDVSYWMESIKVVKVSDGKEIPTIMGKDESIWDFTMPGEPVTVTAVFKEGIRYIKANGDWDLCRNYNNLTASWAVSDLNGNGAAAGWYVVKGNVTVVNRIRITGGVKLILLDNCNLTCVSGIFVDKSKGGTLTIYAQDGSKGELGFLQAGSATNNAAIGGSEGKDNGSITINGGRIKATAGSSGAGIGTGEHGGDGTPSGTITINRGYVTATGGHYAAGIGGGEDRASGPIIINGGKVYAYGGGDASGIGSGEDTNGPSVTITGGEVYAYGGSLGAGIGSGEDGNSGPVTITGGYVYAEGGENGAGIGGGEDGEQAGKVSITGGKVEAYGGYKAAGIGGGEKADGGNVDIINADVKAVGGAKAAGIGGGNDHGGGVVQINSGRHTVEIQSGCKAAIGGGEGKENGPVYLVVWETGCQVWVGPNRSSATRLGSTPIGNDMDKYVKTNAYVRFEPCAHDGAEYHEYNHLTHRVVCQRCHVLFQHEPHTISEDGSSCIQCGYSRTRTLFASTFGLDYSFYWDAACTEQLPMIEDREWVGRAEEPIYVKVSESKPRKTTTFTFNRDLTAYYGVLNRVYIPVEEIGTSWDGGYIYKLIIPEECPSHLSVWVAGTVTENIRKYKLHVIYEEGQGTVEFKERTSTGELVPIGTEVPWYTSTWMYLNANPCFYNWKVEVYERNPDGTDGRLRRGGSDHTYDLVDTDLNVHVWFKPLPTADVYPVFENADGSWTRPGEALDQRFIGKVPLTQADEDLVPEGMRASDYKLSGYSYVYYGAEEAGKRTRASSGQNLTLPKEQSYYRVYLYYSRERHVLNCWTDIAGEQISLSSILPYGGQIAAEAEKHADYIRKILPGWYFAGWSLTPRKNGSYRPEEVDPASRAYAVDDISSMVMGREDLNLYPVMIAPQIQVQLDTGAYDAQASEDNMNGWVNPAAAEYTDTAAAVHMDAAQSRSFMVEYGDTIDMSAMNRAERDGYVLDGWYTQSGVKWEPQMELQSTYCDKDQDGTPIVTAMESGINVIPITLTARWKLRNASVSFDAQPGTLPESSSAFEPAVLSYDESMVLPEEQPVAPEGRSFIGWQDGQGNVYGPGETFTYQNRMAVTGLGSGRNEEGAYVPNQIVLKAAWQMLPAGAIIFDSNGGSVLEPLLTEPEEDAPVYEAGEEEVKAWGEPVRTGYSFTGWYTDKEAQTKVVWPVRIARGKNVTLYAGWQINYYTITFDTLGGPEIPPATYAYGETIVKPDKLSRDHSSFDGWSPQIPKTMPAEDITVKAIWRDLTYWIHWEVDGKRIRSLMTIYGNRISQKPADPVREGRIFAGWRLKGSGWKITDEPAQIPEFMPDTNPVYEASWRMIPKAPAAPLAVAQSPTSILVTGQEAGLEYRLGEGEWIKADETGSALFEGLAPNTEYAVTARVAETDEAVASEASEATLVTTPRAPQAAPPVPELEADRTSVQVKNVYTGAQYRLGEDADWLTPDEEGRMVFEDLEEDTLYQVYARYPQTDIYEASAPSEPGMVYTTKEALTGVAISGNAIYGEILHADAEPAGVKDVTLQWMDGNGILHLQADYEPAAEDIGKALQVTAVQTFADGHTITVSAQTDAVKKMAAPAAPDEIAAIADLASITITEPVGEAYEYSLDKENWQEEPELFGLDQDTWYEIYVRVKETDVQEASAITGPLSVATLKILLKSVAIEGRAAAGETLTVMSEPEQADDVTFCWLSCEPSEDAETETDLTQEEITKLLEEGLAKEGTSYELTEEDIGKEITLAAVQTVRCGDDVVLSAKTGPVEKYDGPKAPAKILAEVSQTSLTVTEPVGESFEYSKDGETWQDSPAFEGLVPNTAYTLYAREKETDTVKAGEIVSEEFTTDKTVARVYIAVQAADGSWQEPTADSGEAEMICVVPEKAAWTQAVGYSFDAFTLDTNKWNAASEGASIALPAYTSAVYLYYTRRQYELSFYGTIAGEGEPVRTERVFYGAPLERYFGMAVNREGYTFAGWAKAPKTDGEYDHKAAVPGKDEYCLFDLIRGEMPAAPLRLYPVLIKHRLEVHLDLGAVDAYADETNMNGWENPAASIYWDTDSAAYLAPTQYRRFVTNSGEALLMNGEKDAATEGMNQATRDGYVLDGWYTQDGVKWAEQMSTDPEYCDRDAQGNPILLQAVDGHYAYYTITLTARWTLRKADVVYDLNGGSGVVRAQDEQVLPNGRVLITNDIPVAPEGQQFIGWMDAQGNLLSAGVSFRYSSLERVSEIGRGVSEETNRLNNNRIVLTAVYADKPEGRGLLIFDSQGGSVVDPVEVAVRAGKETATVQIAVTEDGRTVITDADTQEEIASVASPSRSGYTFMGWVTASGSVTRVSTVTFSRNADDTIDSRYVYGGWKVNTYKITYDTKGGEPVPEMEVRYGAAVPAAEGYTPGETTRDNGHYIFTGWSPVLPATMPDHDIAVTAVWEPASYTIQFADEGEILEDLTIHAVYGEAIEPPADPVKEGAVFRGWTLDGEEVVSLPVHMPDTNPTYTASWKGEQEAPEAPDAQAVSTTILQIVNPGMSREYMIWDPAQEPGSEDSRFGRWLAPTDLNGQRIMRFTGLTPGRTYEVTARLAETADYMASPASAPAVVVMPKEKQAAPEAPQVVAGRTSVEVRPANAGMEYSINDGETWNGPDEDGKMAFDGLNEDTRYTVKSRYKETATQTASPASAATVVYTTKERMTGVAIKGTAAYGETLRAEAEPEGAYGLSWQWYIGELAIEGAASQTHVPEASEIGQVLKVVTTQNFADGTVLTMEAQTDPVSKAAGAATVQNVEVETDITSLTVTAPAGDQYEYSLDSWNWQDSAAFDGLTQNTDYMVYVREKETDVREASEPSEPVQVRTKKEHLQGVAIEGRGVYLETITAQIDPASGQDITYQWYRDHEEIEGATDASYTLQVEDINSVLHVVATQWYDDGSVISAGASLTGDRADGPAAPVSIRVQEDETSITVIEPVRAGQEASAAEATVAAASATVAGQEASAAAAGQEASAAAAGPDRVIYEYSLDGENWQEAPVFEGLTPDTLYTVSARVKGTQTRKESASISTQTKTAATTAQVFMVVQNLDGSWTAPKADASSEQAVMTYTVPSAGSWMGAEISWLKASGYSFDQFEAEEASRVAAEEDMQISLPVGTKTLYIYYSRTGEEPDGSDETEPGGGGGSGEIEPGEGGGSGETEPGEGGGSGEIEPGEDGSGKIEPGEDGTDTDDYWYPSILEKLIAQIALESGLWLSWRGAKVRVEWGSVYSADTYLVYAGYYGRDGWEKVAELDPSEFRYSFKDLGGRTLDKRRMVKVYVSACRKVKGRLVELAGAGMACGYGR